MDRAEIERSIIKTYRKSIWGPFIGALKEYRLIEPDDRIAVCVSGGKDSMLLAKCMQLLERHSEIPFTLKFICMNAGHDDATLRTVRETAEALAIPLTFFDTDIFRVVASQTDGSPCYLCARMRRGWLYKQAQSLGCNKIALGHHFDDVVETALMNIFYGAEIKTMLPRVVSENYEGMSLIRPLYRVREADIIRFANRSALPFIHCACPLSETAASCEAGKRQEMKALVRTLCEQNKDAADNLFRSLHNVNFGMVVAGRESDGAPLTYFYERGRQYE